MNWDVKGRCLSRVARACFVRGSSGVVPPSHELSCASSTKRYGLSLFNDCGQVLRKAATASLFMVFAFGFFAYSDELQPGRSGDEIEASHTLLELLATAHKQHREKLLSFSLKTQEFARKKIKGTFYEAHSENMEIHQGNFRFVDRKHQVTSLSPDGKKSRQEMPHRMVINDGEKYTAHWHPGTDLVYMFEYSSFDKLPKKASDFIARSSPRSILEYGFGVGDMSFSDFVNQIKVNSMPYSIVPPRDDETSSGPDLYLIQLHDPDGQVSAEIGIDASRGCLVKYATAFHHGRVLRQITVQVAEVDSGIWFPKIWEDTSYSLDEKASTAVEKSFTRIEIKDLEINRPFPVTEFSIQRLGFPEGKLIMRTDPQGDRRSMTLVGGELVPSFLSQSDDFAQTAK